MIPDTVSYASDEKVALSHSTAPTRIGDRSCNIQCDLINGLKAAKV
jgi:hypothetical protein